MLRSTKVERTDNENGLHVSFRGGGHGDRVSCRESPRLTAQGNGYLRSCAGTASLDSYPHI